MSIRHNAQRLRWVLLFLLVAGLFLSAAAQNTPAAKSTYQWLDADKNPLPFQSDEEILEFLRTADVADMKDIPTGVTHPIKLTLQKGGVRAHAAFRLLDEEKRRADFGQGSAELFFRDSFKFEPAAYELSRMIGMHSVPPAILRKINGRDGSVQIWVEKAQTEEGRVKNGLADPDENHWGRQVHMMRVFDALVFNTDRTQANILITPDWRIWMIDHTRAFRIPTDLPNEKSLTSCDKDVYARLKALNEADLKLRLKPFLRGNEINSILKRRDALVKHFDKLIAERGQSAVLFTSE